MNITKKDFTNLITNNKSALMGIANELFDLEYVASVTSEYLVENNPYTNFRMSKKKGKYIVFSDNSHLDLTNYEDNKVCCYKYDYFNCFVLVVENKWYDTYDEEWYSKCMYYIIKK